MPTVIIRAKRDFYSLLGYHVKTDLGIALRKATAAALDYTPEDVVVYLFKVPYSNNANDVQIVGVCNHSPEREKYLNSWKNNLTEAWVNFCHDVFYPDPEYGFIEPISAGVSVTMPLGMWQDATAELPTGADNGPLD